MALTQITEKGIKDGEILNADINASAAIAGTKVTPAFGSQNLSTTGTAATGTLTVTGSGSFSSLLFANAGVKYPDFQSSYYGNGLDFLIYHDGSNSKIKNKTGEIQILANTANDVAAKFIPDGAVELYHDNSKKLETTSTGVAVTGNISGSMASNFTLVDVDRVDTSSQHTLSGVNSWNTDSGFGSRTISNYQQGQLIIIRATVPCGIALSESNSQANYGGTRVRLKLTNGSATSYTNERVAWYRADGAGTHETTQNLGINLTISATDTTFSNGDTLTLTIEGKIMTGGAGSATHFLGGWSSTKEVCIERYARQLA
tara:strand:- start:227 stop:1174 length:948 start_codon:yes stop_codon:yes gene_type:complete